MLEGDAQSPNQKLARRMSCPEVLGQKKQHLAIEYGKPSEDEEESGAGSTKGKDGQVVEAEVLFEVGKSVHKKEACLRITRMVKLLKDVKKEVGKEKGKSLDGILGSLVNLVKLEKQSSKMGLKDAKGKLFDAAIQIKKVKKT